uniref:glycine--tRNA ligase n=2 Tax=Helianthus annuus TaxID=4232 RepID=A0A251S0P7_HELAN
MYILFYQRSCQVQLLKCRYQSPRVGILRSSLADYSLDFGTPWGCSCSFCICWRIFSGNFLTVYGIQHRLQPWYIDSAESYANVMQQAGISVDTEQRKKIIVEQANYLANGVDGCLVMQSNLLDEVVNLVEAPVPVLGKFSESFLVLPKDLLVMVMQKHQKYFALTDTNESLLRISLLLQMEQLMNQLLGKEMKFYSGETWNDGGQNDTGREYR